MKEEKGRQEGFDILKEEPLLTSSPSLQFGDKLGRITKKKVSRQPARRLTLQHRQVPLHNIRLELERKCISNGCPAKVVDKARHE